MTEKQIALLWSWLSVVLLIIIFVGYHIYKNKKDKSKVITIQKISLMGILIASLTIIDLMFIPIPGPGNVRLGLHGIFEFAIGYMFNPLISLIIVLTSDQLRILLQGFVASPFYFFAPPIVAMCGYFCKILYNTTKIKNNLMMLIIIESISTIFLILSITLACSIDMYDSREILSVMIAMVSIGYIVFQVSVFYMWKYKKEKIRLFTWVYLMRIVATIITSWILGTLNSNIIMGIEIDISWFSRIVSSSYMIPLLTTATTIVISNVKLPSMFMNEEIVW